MFRYLTISFAFVHLSVSQFTVVTSLAVSSLFLSATPAFSDCTSLPPTGISIREYSSLYTFSTTYYPNYGPNDTVVYFHAVHGTRVNDHVCNGRSWVHISVLPSTGGDSSSTTETSSAEDALPDIADASDIIVGAYVAAALVALGFLVFSGGGENSFISFKTIKADNHIYSQTRQWIGFEHDVSQNFKIALGSFWFVHNDVASILPSAENIGGELVLALGARKSAKGELALTISAFVNDQSANLDDSLRVATDRFGVWDERIALTWRKAF